MKRNFLNSKLIEQIGKRQSFGRVAGRFLLSHFFAKVSAEKGEGEDSVGDSTLTVDKDFLTMREFVNKLY